MRDAMVKCAALKYNPIQDNQSAEYNRRNCNSREGKTQTAGWQHITIFTQMPLPTTRQNCN
ncbi:hypothetical protein CA11_43950 [Gimesia maris]|nr:hypothetical protein CA11_43950 [Gimesia maris]